MAWRELSRRARSGLDRAVRAIDWSLTIMVAGFLAVAPWQVLSGLVPVPTRPLWGLSNPNHIAYEASIAAAAVKRPNDVVDLRTIRADITSVDVVNFGGQIAKPADDAEPVRQNRYIWVALRSQLQEACAGTANPTLRLQQILGLPPGNGGVVNELVVPRDRLFRPCVAGGDLESPKCALDFPKAPPPVDPKATSTADTDLRRDYDRLRFVATQMWNSYRTGFPTNQRSPGDYPLAGYPFTGMGWTYDWSDVPSHVGVSEFVLEPDTPLKVVGTKTPSEFCAATSRTN